MRILFVGFAHDRKSFDEVSVKDRNSHVSAFKLQWNIIKGVEKASGRSIDLVSALLVSEYPYYPRIFIRGRKWKHSEESDDIMIPYINIILLRHLTRFISCLRYVISWLINNRKEKEKKILVYGLHSPFVFSVILAVKLFGGKTALIIPDMPMYMDMGLKRNITRKIIKPLDNHLLTKIIKKTNGLIVLTKIIAEECAPQVPYIVVEGAISFEDMKDIEHNINTRIYDNAEKKIMFAGRLTEIAGLRLLIEAFAIIGDPNYRLMIFGKGPMETEIIMASQKDSRITYGGFLPTEEIMKISKNVTVLVTLGLSKYNLIHYSFPSKMLEYMKTGTPVLATGPGISSEYFDYIYLVKDETPEGLAELIQEVCSQDAKDLYRFGQRAKEWVICNKSYIRQGQRIYEFIQRM